MKTALRSRQLGSWERAIALALLMLLAGLNATDALTAAAQTPTLTRVTTPTGPLPDLTIQHVAVAISPDGNYCGGPSGTRATIKNIGGAAAGAFVVTINGQPLNVAGLAAGTITNLWIQGYNAASTSVIADATRLVAENNEHNNSFSGPVPVPGGACPAPPDLIVERVMAAPETSTCGSPYGIRAWIKNIGIASAGASTVSINGELAGVGALAAGSVTSVWVRGYATSATVIADVNKQVVESNELNNSFSGSIPIATPLPCPITPTRTRTRTPTPCGGCITITPTRTPTGSVMPSRTPTRTASTATTRTATTSGYPSWTAGTFYAVGTRISYAGANYQCIQAHTSQPGWEPPNTPALWGRI